jgi:3-(3-hydroxy-phenyl)propionate hydroxylase
MQALHLSALASSIGLRAAQVLTSGQSVTQAAQAADAIEALLDASGKLQQACKMDSIAAKHSPTWAIIRPDSYLAASGAGIDSGLIRAVQMATGI